MSQRRHTGRSRSQGRAPAWRVAAHAHAAPSSSKAAGYPDTGVPEQAEERPTPAPGASGAGNLRQRFHTAARSVLQGCSCAACQGAMAYLDAGTDLDETGRKDAARGAEGTGGLHEAALTRAVAAGLSASATRLDRMDGCVDRLRAAVEAGVGQIARTMGDLRQRIEQLEAQPVLGGRRGRWRRRWRWARARTARAR